MPLSRTNCFQLPAHSLEDVVEMTADYCRRKEDAKFEEAFAELGADLFFLSDHDMDCIKLLALDERLLCGDALSL